MFSEFCWFARRWLGKGRGKKCEEPITHWLKSGGGVDGGGGDRESWRASEALAGATSFLVKEIRLQQRVLGSYKITKNLISKHNVLTVPCAPVRGCEIMTCSCRTPKSDLNFLST